MTAWLYKWLPIIFGCHCRDDRSFHWHGHRFPICARCTGELIGILGFLISAFLYLPPLGASLILMLPLVVDGFVQRLTRYESTNPRRLITGILFGYGLTAFFVLTNHMAFRFGYNLVH